MREQDLLVHHPYDSFTTSVERFVEQAVADPDVLAIKLTIYRTSDDTPLVPALVRATERGKQAVCLVELKARFDEQANITWARALEQSGVHVVYGHPSLKTHTKCVLVIRREGDGVRHYMHIGTGNYHPKTARLYTDVGLFTCDEDLGRRRRGHVQLPHRLRAAEGVPQGAHRADAPARRHPARDREDDRRARGRQGRPDRAEDELARRPPLHPRAVPRVAGRRAGRPQHPRHLLPASRASTGVSENIRVVSVVGRFLEHSRIFTFTRGDETRVLIGSADLMPRNLDTRVELVAPVEDAEAKADLLDVLERSLADDSNAWELRDGRDVGAPRARRPSRGRSSASS